MSDKEPQVVHGDTVDVGKPSKKRRCTAHCKRFWWAYLIAFCCVVVLVVCLVIFVGVPNIAQDKLDEAKLNIDGVNILETEPDNYRMEVNSTITTDGKIHADVDAFTGTMYLEGIEPRLAFATLDFPATTAEKHQTVNVSQHVTIADMDAFTTFNVWFTNNETVQISVEGDTKVKPQGLDRKYDVKFRKTLDVSGLNLFKGTEVLVDDAKLSLTEDKAGKNFYGKADIPNASHFTLDIGNVTFTNYVEDEDVGTIWIDNLLLHPGSNVVPISASLDQVKIVKLLGSDKYCEKGIIPFKMLGKSVKNHGEDLSYFATALASANQTTDIDIRSIVKNNLGTTIGCGGH